MSIVVAQVWAVAFVLAFLAGLLSLASQVVPS